MTIRRTQVLVAVFALSAAVAGCGGSSGSSGVSASAYVKSICSAVGPFEKDVQARSSALNLSTRNPAQGKKTLHGFLAAIVADADKAVSELKSAGTPNVANGSQIASSLVKAFTALKTDLAQAASKAGSLPTSSPTAFRSAAEALGSSIQSSMSSIGSSLNGLKSADLEKAAAKDATCKSLAGA